MQLRIAHAFVFAAAVAAVVAACDMPTAPPQAQRMAGLRGARLDAPVTADVLQRTAPLPAALSASATIGPQGGRLVIPEAGVSVRFPAGAVSTPVTITVTALAGANVAYSFAPEGLVFANSPVISQDLKNTTAFGNPSLSAGLEGGYFLESELSGTQALVRESRPTTVYMHGARARWTVEHFSGYLLTTSKTGGYIGSSGRSGSIGF
jgi:hypothetical protein